MSAIRCYICGEALGGEFTLIALSQPTDRVFLCHTECEDRIDEANDAVLIPVERNGV